MKRYMIKFKYADEMSRWEWRNQSCSLCADSREEALRKFVKLYGFNEGDCLYVIQSVVEEDE